MGEYANRLGVDYETNGKDIRDGQGHTIGMSIAYSFDEGYSGYSYYFPFRYPYGNLDWSYRDKLKTFVASKPVTFHNAKHDIVAGKSLNIETPDDFHCSMLIAHAVNENQLSYSLDHLAKNVVGIPGKYRDERFESIKKALGWGDIPPEVMAEYGAQDAVLHWELDQHFWPLYKAEDEVDEANWETEKEFTKVVIAMEQQGIEVDLELAQQQIMLGDFRMTELLDEIGYNPASRKDLEALLIDKLGLPILKRSKKTDNPSFDKKVMEEYEELLNYSNNPVANQVLEFRGYQKAVSSYWKSYLRLVSPDGRVRPNFKQHGTRTGRLSCADPNLQQIPRITVKPWNKCVKAGFVPRSGYRLWEADYSQLEMRLQAAYAQETKLIDIFKDPERDLFSEMAAELGLPRFETKTLNYALGYGAQYKKIAYMLGISENAAMRLIENYFATYSGLLNIRNLASATVKGQGFIRYWTTRRRHFENPMAEAHKGMNAVMQGGAAEIVKRVMIRVHNEIVNPPECYMLLQVHDALVFEIEEGKEQKYLPEIRRVMEDVKPDFGVPFRVEIKEWAK